MTVVTDLIKDFNQALKYGEQIRFQYYTQTLVGEYDDDVKYTQSGTDFWCSGLVQPIDNKFGGHDAVMMQQGKTLTDDRKIYVEGSVQTSGLGMIKIGTGSPPTQEYQIIDEGRNIVWGVNGSSIYKKIYVRYLPNGSFIGE